MPESSRASTDDGLVRALVRKKAKSLVGKAGLTAGDVADLEQEMLGRIEKPLRSFDPSAAPLAAFVSLLVDRSASAIVRHHLAAKRCGPDHFADVSDLDLDRDQRTQRGEEVPARRDLAIDVRAWIETLPPDLKFLAELLKTDSRAEAARALDRPRSSLESQVTRLRRRLANAGFRDYLENPPTD